MTRFKTDENLPPLVADRLQSAGHDAVSVAQQRMQGASDDALASACRTEDRVLVTLDLDFSDTRAYPPGSSPGIVVFRPRREDRAALGRATDLLVRGLVADDVRGALWIVEDDRIRVRDARADPE